MSWVGPENPCHNHQYPSPTPRGFHLSCPPLPLRSHPQPGQPREQQKGKRGGGACFYSSVFFLIPVIVGFPGASDSEESACNAGDLGLIPGLGRSPGEGNGFPLQYSCLGNPMDRGAWQTAVHGVSKSRTWPNDSHFHCWVPPKCPWLPFKEDFLKLAPCVSATSQD